MNPKNKNCIKQAEPLGFIFLSIGLALAISSYTNVKFLGTRNFSLETILCILSIPLALKKYWPKCCLPHIKLYSYIVITYSLPFFLTFMYLNNPNYKIWSLSLLAGSIILTQCIAFKKLWPVIFIGCFLAALVFKLESPNKALPDDILIVLSCCLGIILYFSHFSKKIMLEYEDKIKLLEGVGMTIAHELRTPIASIKAGSLGIENVLPSLIDAYEKAASSNLNIHLINSVQLNTIKKAIRNMYSTCVQANMSIDIFLKNVSEPQKTKTSLCSAKDIIIQSIKEYPLSEESLEKINFDLDQNFMFIGDENLIKHVFFNLLKNALFHVRCPIDHKISILLSENNNYGKIIVMDTGTGIDPKNLPYIFDKFFSSNNQKGTGLGLHYCKNCIEQFGGKIECKSEQNKYSEFSIYLPKA